MKAVKNGTVDPSNEEEIAKFKKNVLQGIINNDTYGQFLCQHV